MTSYSKKTLLVVDDDRIFCQAVQDFFQGNSLEVLVVHEGAQAKKISAQKKIDVILLDQKLPDGEGQALCSTFLKHNEQTKIIFITAYPSFDHAVAAIKAGAYDYLSKPFELEELKLSLERAFRTSDLERVEQLQSYKSDKESEETIIIGRGKMMMEVKRLVNLTASAQAPVLITGETGTGKNVVARAIHYRSPARQAAFISINCAALPENLIEAELFGHEKGAFTGAVALRRGVFEMAEGGTLFLDEIGSMPLPLQSKLLNVLEDKKVKRLGGETQRSVDVRIIVATNTDLEKAVKEGKFRQDLYYRLNVIRIHLPPLRERRQDIPELCDYLIKQINNHPEIKLPEPELAKLMDYPWPGNVRELKNVLERAVILQRGSVLCPSELLGTVKVPGNTREADASPMAGKSFLSLEETEKNYIKYALEQFTDNYSRTAKALGISLSTLKRKIKAYHISNS